MLDLAIIQLHRLECQHGGDATTATDGEGYLAYFGQHLGKGVLPGRNPVGRLGLPALGGGALALAQDHAVAGKGQG
ncbi:hypothetical protein D3C85_1141860 [compost metagenome]